MQNVQGGRVPDAARASLTEAVWQDLRDSVRTLRKAPGFAAVAVLTLALGIGASTALFSVVRGVLLKPLPYRHAGRLAVVLAEQDYEGARKPVRTQLPSTAVAAWPGQTGTIERVGFYAGNVAALSAPQAAASSELVDTAIVSASFFETIGGELVLGRGLTASDDPQPHAVVSARLWRRLSGGVGGSGDGGSGDGGGGAGGGGAVGSTAGGLDLPGHPLILNGQPYTIVGVAADSFQVPAPLTDVWLTAGYARAGSPSCCDFTPIVRLKPGVTTTAATDSVAALVRALAADMPRSLGGVRVQVVGLHDLLVKDARPALLMLSAAVGLLLALACANVTNLLLARNSVRTNQLAVRRALGASHGRLVTQALAESGLLAVAGSAAGIGLAALSLRALQAWPPGGLPRLDTVAIDGAVLLFACAAAVASTLAVGLLPALQPVDLMSGLKASQRSATGGRHARRALRAVTVAQLALSVILLVGGLLLGRSLVALMRTDLGVTPAQVATASLNLTMGRTLTDQQQIDLVNRVVERIAALPQVTSVGVGTARPPDTSRMRLTLNRTDDPNARASFQAAGVPASPGYFRALDVRLERGRLFTAADDAQAPPVVIMSADTARQLFGREDPLGRTISLPVLRKGTAGREEMTVVGITGSVKYSGLDRMADAVVYRPFAQQPWRAVFLVARTTGDPELLASRLQREIAAVDRGITVAGVTTMDQVLADVTSQPRFRTWLLIAFASMALAIAGVGLYGVIATSVSQRMREIGIRMALGADRRRIRLMVLREGLVLALLGGALGLAGAYAGTSLLASLLFGIAPNDPASFALAAAGVVVAGLAACYVPAGRAAKADPLVVLKTE